MNRNVTLAGLAWTFSFLALCTAVTQTQAEETAKSAEEHRAEDRLPTFTKAREAAALVFIKEQRPEVLELLKLVQEKNLDEYQKAIRQFFDWSEKLAENQPQARGYVALAIQAWQTQIQTQILGAQLMRHPEEIDKLKLQLIQVIGSSVDVQIAHVDQQIAQVESQLAALRKQKQSLTSQRDDIIKARVAAIEEMVTKHREGTSLQAELHELAQAVQQAALKKQQEGGDVTEVAEIMQQIGPLVQQGKAEEAKALLQKASELLQP